MSLVHVQVKRLHRLHSVKKFHLNGLCLTFSIVKLYNHVTVHRNRFLLNNQPDALIIQIYCVIKRSSIPTLPGSGHQKNLHETYQCRMYSRKLLMMGREDARNM
jgi:hypothetical protein